ncbi:hypothetical protein [Pseudoduganella namucuonensis]|uniref:Tetratricopeptide repeat protein n=1 Tax=Pseudoduganella namucuonensis TaxID=1035707 RepID=A0A1I7K345_9BURK|nr:hypothetical protein [Pseudoduganella namucuonensis]SFU91805.1 hypothetical protein SAMN05216552_1014121 [Pseudoduganella namucuonensis]
MGYFLKEAGLAAAVLLCGAASVNAQQAATPTQSVAVKGYKNASPWFKAESQHFIVFSNTSNADVTQLLKNLEKLDHVLRIYTKDFQAGAVSQQKMTLYYHDRIGGFNDAVSGQPEEAVGLYNSCAGGVQGYGVHLERIAGLNNEQLATSTLNNSLSYAFEAYARHFLYRYTDIRTPSSYIDGFAQYFSTIRFSDNQMSIGRVPPSVARYVYFVDKGRSHRLTYQDIFEPKEAKDPASSDEPAVRLEYQAKSWLLAHYMLSSNDNLPRRDKYLNLVHQEVPAGKALDEAFELKGADIGDTMWRYRLKGIQVLQLEMPDLPSAQPSFTSLPESSTDFLLADAGLRSCPDAKTGQALLRTVSQHPGGVPNNDTARLTVGRAHVDWGKAEDALPHLADAARKDASSHEAAYLLGLANLRLAAQRKDAEAAPYLEAAATQLARARVLNPRSPEAAYAAHQLGLRAAGPPDKQTLEAAVAAWRYGHEVNTYARSAALSYAYLGRSAEADNALTVLAHNARDPEMAKWAKAWQARLGAGVTRADLAAEMRREPAQRGAFKEWTVAGENLMQTVEYNAGIEDMGKYLETMRLSNPMSEKTHFVAPSKK